MITPDKSNDLPGSSHDLSNYIYQQQSTDGKVSAEFLSSDGSGGSAVNPAMGQQSQYSSTQQYYCMGLHSSPCSNMGQYSGFNNSGNLASTLIHSAVNSVESPEYLAHRLLVEFGKTRTNYNSLVPRIVEVMRLFRDYGPSRCPIPVVSNLEELLNDGALNRIEHRYPNSLDAGFLVLCTERRALRSGGGGKYYFIDTSGRLVGCHKSDLSTYAEKGVLCGPVLLKNLIFVFIMRGTYGLDPRCKSSNPQRLLEYYESLAKEGKAIDVQRLVRVWSMEIFPEAPYDGGFPHCSLLWVKRMHVGAHISKWKRSQWHNNQVRTQDMYVTPNVSNLTSAGQNSTPYPLLVGPNYCNYYQQDRKSELPGEIPNIASSQQHYPRNPKLLGNENLRPGLIKRRRLGGDKLPNYSTSRSSDHSTVDQSCQSNVDYKLSCENYISTMTPKATYLEAHAAYLARSDSLLGMHSSDTSSAHTNQIGSTTTNQKLTTDMDDDLNYNNMLSANTLLNSGSDTTKQLTASNGSTPLSVEMPTILTSNYQTRDEYYSGDFQRTSASEDTPTDSQGASTQKFNTFENEDALANALSDNRVVQSIYSDFDKIFAISQKEVMIQWSVAILYRLNDAIATAASYLLSSQSPNDKCPPAELKQSIKKKIIELTDVETLKEYLRILLACLVQQQRLRGLFPLLDRSNSNFPHDISENPTQQEDHSLGGTVITDSVQSKKSVINSDENDRLIETYVDSRSREEAITPSCNCNHREAFPVELYQFNPSEPTMTPSTSEQPLIDSVFSSPSSPYYYHTSTPYPMRACSEGSLKSLSAQPYPLDPTMFHPKSFTTSDQESRKSLSYIESDQQLTVFQQCQSYQSQYKNRKNSTSSDYYCEMTNRHASCDETTASSSIYQQTPPSAGNCYCPNALTLLESINQYEDVTEDSVKKDEYNLKLQCDNAQTVQCNSSSGNESFPTDSNSNDICHDVDVRLNQPISVTPPPLHSDINDKHKDVSRYNMRPRYSS